MNTLGVLAVGGAIGILGACFFLLLSAHVEDTARVQQARMDCETARFDQEFARMSGDSQPAQQRAASEANTACGAYRSEKAATQVREIERSQPVDKLTHDLKAAINK
ncbi:hypothetical protein [Burkholderia multivorans]|uniref:hypothetical protein n=1 Tax=Burkholderia multivorans TaxID=87883 RepID=UPI00158DCCA5|nr:hypothetical protein [Burkholderia multivorans]